MKEFTYTIKDALGLHVRPAGLLVKKAMEFPCDIVMKKGDASADVKRIMNLMGLGVRQGDEIVLQCSGEQEEEAMASLTAFLEENL